MRPEAGQGNNGRKHYNGWKRLKRCQRDHTYSSVIIEEEKNIITGLSGWCRMANTDFTTSATCLDMRRRQALLSRRQKADNFKGWKINVQVCYDLRFPVWASSRRKEGKKRILWIRCAVVCCQLAGTEKPCGKLFCARAIENQCYVIGVNRRYGWQRIYHSGNSLVIDPLGSIISHGWWRRYFHYYAGERKTGRYKIPFPFHQGCGWVQVIDNISYCTGT